MPILVDGHNLIGRLQTVSLKDADDEAQLIGLLKVYRARTRKAITVVFDPGGAYALSDTLRIGGIDVVFAPHGSTADALIRRRVQRSRNPRDWLVVTSDRALAESVRQLGARVRSADAFAADLDRPASARSATDPEPDVPPWKDASLSPSEVDAWLTLFENRD